MTLSNASTGAEEFRLFGLRSWRGRSRPGPSLYTPRVVLWVVIFAWFPLVVLALVSGTLNDGPWPLATDLAVHSRFLVELPALLLGKAVANRLFGRAMRYLTRTGAVDEEHRRALASCEHTFTRYRDSPWVTSVLVALAYFLTWREFEGGPAPGTFWVSTHGWRTAAPGFWYYVIARPLVVTQILSWLWAFALWAWLLVKLVRLPLKLYAFHPDGCGGFGPILTAHRMFVVFSFALSTDLAGGLANRLWHLGEAHEPYVKPLLAFAVVLTAVLLSPLLVLARALVPARIDALERYGVLGFELSREVQKRATEMTRADLGEESYAMISAHCDSEGGMSVIRKTRPVVVDRMYVLTFLLATVTPLLLAFSVRVPLTTMVRQLGKLYTL